MRFVTLPTASDGQHSVDLDKVVVYKILDIEQNVQTPEQRELLGTAAQRKARVTLYLDHHMVEVFFTSVAAAETWCTEKFDSQVIPGSC